mmetsp:Transcript_42734/g.108502  ORF Transcript_42734/g.108502 Transcript_42734/m.108502 type:complete len:324 (-) Transcript_42734:49-1020(-)
MAHVPFASSKLGGAECSVPLLLALEDGEIQEEGQTQQACLAPRIDAAWEHDRESVRGGATLLLQACPHFADLRRLLAAVVAADDAPVAGVVEVERKVDQALASTRIASDAATATASLRLQDVHGVALFEVLELGDAQVDVADVLGLVLERGTVGQAGGQLRQQAAAWAIDAAVLCGDGEVQREAARLDVLQHLGATGLAALADFHVEGTPVAPAEPAAATGLFERIQDVLLLHALFRNLVVIVDKVPVNARDFVLRLGLASQALLNAPSHGLLHKQAVLVPEELLDLVAAHGLLLRLSDDICRRHCWGCSCCSWCTRGGALSK